MEYSRDRIYFSKELKDKLIDDLQEKRDMDLLLSWTVQELYSLPDWLSSIIRHIVNQLNPAKDRIPLAIRLIQAIPEEVNLEPLKFKFLDWLFNNGNYRLILNCDLSHPGTALLQKAGIALHTAAVEDEKRLWEEVKPLLRRTNGPKHEDWVMDALAFAATEDGFGLTQALHRIEVLLGSTVVPTFYYWWLAELQAYATSAKDRYNND